MWDDVVHAVDAGDPVAEFLSEHLAAPVRLVRMPRETVRAADPSHARPADRVGFADGFPFLLTSVESLGALNARLDDPVCMRRFRPNFVVAGDRPFAEDAWRGIEVGALTFHAVKACSRCSIVDVDPDAGTRGRGVLTALAGFRARGSAVLFGQNLVHDGPGVLREGMRVHPR